MKKYFIIFGATGDLTSRYLMPALSELCEAKKLPEAFSIIGIALSEMDTEGFRRHMNDKLERLAPDSTPSSRKAMLDMLEYRQADVSKKEDILKALGSFREPAVFYLALPPFLFRSVVEALAVMNLPEESAIVIEKPFGEDLSSAQALNHQLHLNFPEHMIFRIDSFLGEQTVHNILGLRFANHIFEPLWNNLHIEKVEIIWDETLALEGRASYYDKVGALRDMIQNHLLQLLCIVAMEPPHTMSERDFRDRKTDVLRAVRRLSEDEVMRWTVRGRYGKGRIGERSIPAYRDEEGVDPRHKTETFASITLWIDNWRWAGVPFILRTGKALAGNRMEIILTFKSAPHLIFGKNVIRKNSVRLELNPDRIALGVNIVTPCEALDLKYTELTRELTPQYLSAYARLLLRVMEGRQNLFIRNDEAEESWKIVAPVIEAWTNDKIPLVEYPAGSEGPEL
ncbi:MAG: glucose-6-phosphate dehydrogenase [Candidatus Loosdrechtia sp.]|uniref:glucose-6-phosphate dehydrogenase n=1 Tax=Candidatus Loosdrechtia sp. TaxID=3101272 RepID=UPI003A77BA92|nr:MAG: glucose-6-phosphate dehydrogenase [Candidatus Jettenia sp. AMX2]